MFVYRVLGGGKPLPDAYAIGDCSGYGVDTGLQTLPALAAVAERQVFIGRFSAPLGMSGTYGRSDLKKVVLVTYC